MHALLLLLTACSSNKDAPVTVHGRLTVPDDAVFRLEIHHDGGVLDPGSGFVAKLPKTDRVIGVTAHHLFSPAGGLARELRASEVPKFVTKIVPKGIHGLLPEVGPMLYVQGAQVTVDRQDWTTDLAAFTVPDSYRESALPFVSGTVSVGSTIWLVTVPHENQPRLVEAEVEFSTHKMLMFKLSDPSIETRGTSGCPLINDKGEVVGMNTAEGSNGKELHGTAHPAESIVEQLLSVGE